MKNELHSSRAQRKVNTGLGECTSYCRLTTYRHRFARAAPAPRAKRNDSKNRGRASPVNTSYWFAIAGLRGSSLRLTTKPGDPRQVCQLVKCPCFIALTRVLKTEVTWYFLAIGLARATQKQKLPNFVWLHAAREEWAATPGKAEVYIQLNMYHGFHCFS